MDLGEFIRRNRDAIVEEWERFATTLTPAARGLSHAKLRDHAHEILEALTADIESPQAAGEQSEKSKGRGLEHRMEAVGKVHAALRIEDGFKLGQLVAEYRALRASILRLFEEAGGNDMRQVIRFSEAIDEALVEATNRYVQAMEQTRDQFLAILGHDLRNPLGSILMSGALLTTLGGGRAAEDRTAKVAMRILTSAERMKRMVNNLLDLARARLGVGIPIAPQPMSLDDLLQEVLAEFQALHPDHSFDFHSEGDLRGVWDSDRLAQVFSNLVGNALQHGAPNRPIAVVARAEAEDVVIEVHNEGPAIPRERLANIFDPLVRHPEQPPGRQDSTSLGLGLYIAREIVVAHQGTVMATSTDREGTTFSIRLPRRSAARDLGEQPDQHSETGGIVVQ